VKYAGTGFNPGTVEDKIALETERMLDSRAMFEQKKANRTKTAERAATAVEKQGAKSATNEWTASDEEDMAARIGKHVKIVRKYPSLRVKEDKADDPLLQQMLLKTELEAEENLAEENLQKYGET
jgi:hypothetical protein